MKIAFHTLGCKVNQYETQVLKEKFIKEGYEVVGDTDFADVYVINTCTVTNLSDRKSRQYIRKVKRINPDSVTAVVGCYAQVSPEEAASIEGVSIVAGTNEKNNLVEYVNQYLADHGSVQSHIKDYSQLGEYEETGTITSMESRTRAFIKIQEGCSQFCSYCIIPFARGPVRSRAIKEIVKEAENLIRQGFKELVLTGINTALYGTEEGFEPDKLSVTEADGSLREIYGIEIIVKVLNDLLGDFRIRLSSLEPTVINEQYIRNLISYEKLCPHLHLSLQSGSDQILKAMNRTYGREQYKDIVRALREYDGGFGITTDIIAGFPGETDRDFQDSLEMVESCVFSRVHAFKYSKRSGTKAAEMKDQVPPQVKARRSEKLIAAAAEAQEAFYRSNAGMVREVLFELYDADQNCFRGYADNYIEVYCESSENLENTFRKVRLLKPWKQGMKGELAD